MTSLMMRTRMPSARVPVSAPTIQRECERQPELFDLPEPAPIEVPSGPVATAIGTTSYVTFDAMEAEDEATNTFAHSASRAIAACKACPFLAMCQKEADEGIRSGRRPQGAVVAAVAFNDAGLPEPAVHDKPVKAELEQHTLDADLDIHVTRASTDWVAADLEPISMADREAVSAALDDHRTDLTISLSHLDTNPDTEPDGRIVLSYPDEWAVIQRGLANEVTPHRLSQILGCTWTRMCEMAFIGGHDVEGSFKPRAWIKQRRSIADLDRADQTDAINRRRRAQANRDKHLIEQNQLHNMITDLATIHRVRVSTSPPNLCGRIKRAHAIR